MTTKVRRRFNFSPDILDRVAGGASNSYPAIIIDGAHTNGRRYNTVTSADWRTFYPDENEVVFDWLEAIFSHSRRPRNAVVIHRLASETVAEALDDALLLGADFRFLCGECVDVGQTVPDGTETITTPLVDQVLSLSGQSVQTVTIQTVDSIAEIAGGAATEDANTFQPVTGGN